jgi:hypothetical protein
MNLIHLSHRRDHVRAFGFTFGGHGRNERLLFGARANS